MGHIILVACCWQAISLKINMFYYFMFYLYFDCVERVHLSQAHKSLCTFVSAFIVLLSKNYL